MPFVLSQLQLKGGAKSAPPFEAIHQFFGFVIVNVNSVPPDVVILIGAT